MGTVVDLMREALGMYIKESYSMRCLDAIYADNGMHRVSYNGSHFVVFQSTEQAAPVFGDVRGMLLCKSADRVAYHIHYDITTHMARIKSAIPRTLTPA